MSEIQSRPAASTRGRGAGRGRGGGGFSNRGGGRVGNRSSSNTNGDPKHDDNSASSSLEDEGQVGELKRLYGEQVEQLKGVAPDWSDVDLLTALQETNGDVNTAASRIIDGTIERWGEVSKAKKERKPKNDVFTTTTAETPRGGRGGRTEGGRGRGRATERGGRGGARGKPSHATTNGHRNKDSTELSISTEDAWETQKDTQNAPEETAAPAVQSPPATVTPAAPIAAAAAATKTWAKTLFAPTPAAPKPAPKPKEAPAPPPAETSIEPLPPAEPIQEEPEAVENEEATPEPVKEEPVTAPAAEITVVVPEIALLPSKDQLTETNLEQIPNEAKEIETETNVSEAADSWDPRAQGASNNATPLSASQQQHQGARAPTSGFAATATKAADRTSTRTPNIPRRIFDQREAVRMPGNRDQVDRAAVQFGAFNLNEEDDIDGDREEPETRPQPPQDSPVTHPRTSLPPAQPAPVPEAFPAQKPAATLPPTGPAGIVSSRDPTVFPDWANPHLAAVPPTAPSQPSAPAQGGFPEHFLSSPSLQASGRPVYSQLPEYTVAPPSASTQATQAFGGRFGQQTPQEPPAFATAKSYESYQNNPSAAQQAQYESSFQSQVPTTQPQQPVGAFTSAPSEYSHYAADPQGRHAYNNYYGYGQQTAQSQQESLATQAQRGFGGGYNAPQSENLGQYPQSAGQHSQSRFGAAAGAESQVTGTPTPTQSTTQTQAPTSHGQSHSQQQQPQNYPGYADHPYYNNPYYNSYMQNYNAGAYQQGGFGGPYGKGSYPTHQYGMTPQAPHQQYGSSPAAGFGQSALHRESGVSSGISEYGRAASGQSGQQQGLGGSGFGGMHEGFGRGASSYQSQGAQAFNAPGSQGANVPSAGDDLKPFGEAKAGSGPSPSLGAAARPGSATNNAPSQTGLPPPHSGQQSGLGMGGYGGYPAHAGQGLHANQTAAGSGYGMSASGANAQGGPQNTYGGYGQGFGGSYGGYGGNARHGWGNQYH
ncbi:hypothetical protein V8F06_008255 [Rhypophila decipiens]